MSLSTNNFQQPHSIHESNPIRIAVVVCLFNAGISTRGLEIAKALLDGHQNVEIRFFSWSGGPDTPTYNDIVTNEGFSVTNYGLTMDRTTWNKLLEAEHRGTGWQDFNFLVSNMQGCIQALKDFRPDVVVHGLQFDAAAAAQILGIPDVMYAPIPVDGEYIAKHILTDIPDSQSTWLMRLIPRPLRRHLTRSMVLKQKRKPSLIDQAAKECGWEQKEGQTDLFSSATHYLLTDLAGNYNERDLPENVHIIGPLFATTRADGRADLPANVQRLMELQAAERKVFVTMGSTGAKEHLMEAVKAISDGTFTAIVALAPNRCSIQDFSSMDLPDSVILTESFLPAGRLAAWADVVVTHGGQGTVQTALAAGTPLVGVAMQWEQEFNLDNVVRRGAGIRLPKRKWKAARIRESVLEVINCDSFRSNAQDIQNEMRSIESAKEAASIVLRCTGRESLCS